VVRFVRPGKFRNERIERQHQSLAGGLDCLHLLIDLEVIPNVELFDQQSEFSETRAYTFEFRVIPQFDKLLLASKINLQKSSLCIQNFDGVQQIVAV
jgi:hypothetical protein